MSSDPNRAFHYAVLASIALHAVLLFGLSLRDSAKRAAPLGPIIARLVELPARAPSAPQSEPPKPPAAPLKPPPEPVKPKSREKPISSRPAAKPTPAPAEAPPAQPAPAAPPATASAAPTAPAAAPPGPVAKIEPAPAIAPSAPREPAIDPGSLAQYRLQLIGVAGKYKRYPRVAMDNNWEGEVVVRMVIGANGMISALRIKAGSGHEVLDQQALDMFRKAMPLVQIPAALRGTEFTIELRAIYSLKDQGPG